MLLAQDEFDFFWNLTAHSKAMTENCDTGGRKLMHLGLVKLLGPDNKSIPHCPYHPIEEDARHRLDCSMAIHIYTRQEHTGFNTNHQFGKEKYPKFPENTTFLVGKDLTEELEMMGILTAEDLLANAWRITGSYTKEPYPGHSFYWVTDVPKPGWPLCIPCHSREILSTMPILKVRGLCSQTAFDLQYIMLNDEDGYVEYVGKQNSVIKYNADEEIWTIQSLPFPKITATSKAIFTTLFVGKHTWHIFNDKKCQSGEVELSVKLSTCVEGKFTCSDGVCIDIDERCDRVQHCKDWSDELGCSIVQIPPGYLREFVPIKLMANKTISKVEIIVGVSIIDVINIFEKEGSIGFRFSLSMEWKDDRVGFLNLRDESKMNLLSKSEMHSVWAPSLMFYNTLNEEKTLVDSDSNMYVCVSFATV